MQIEYTERLDRKYMAVTADSEIKTGSFVFRMVTENQIEGLLDTGVSCVDGKDMVLFDITGFLSLNDLLKEIPADELLLEKLFKGIAETRVRLQRYLISGDYLKMSAECIFFDPPKDRFCFAVIPEIYEESRADLLKLSEFLVSRLPYNDRTAAEMGYGFYRLCISGTITVEELKKLAETPAGHRKEAGNKIPEPKMSADVFLEEFRVNEQAGLKRKPSRTERGRNNGKKKDAKTGKGKKTERVKNSGNSKKKSFLEFLKTDHPIGKKKKAAGKNKADEAFFDSILKNSRYGEEDFRKDPGKLFGNEPDGACENMDRNAWEDPYGEPDEIGSEGFCEDPGTVFFSGSGREGKEPVCCLVPKNRNEESINLEDDICVIGRSRDRCSIRIDNATVSRRHAKLEKNGNTYDLIDTGSRNGTRLNGRRIPKDVPFSLSDGDTVSFAGAEYRFCTSAGDIGRSILSEQMLR